MAPATSTIHRDGYSLHPVFATRHDGQALKARGARCHVDLRGDARTYRTTTALGSAHYADDDGLFHSRAHRAMAAIQSRAVPVAFDLQSELYGSHISLGADPQRSWLPSSRDAFRSPADASRPRPAPAPIAPHASSVQLGVDRSRSYDTTTATAFQQTSSQKAAPAPAQSRLGTTSSSVTIGGPSPDGPVVWASSTKAAFSAMVRVGRPSPPSDDAKRYFLGDHIRLSDGVGAAWASVSAAEFAPRSPAPAAPAPSETADETRRSHVVLGDVAAAGEPAATSSAVGFQRPHLVGTAPANPHLGAKSSVRIQMDDRGPAWRSGYSDDFQARSPDGARADRVVVQGIRETMANRSGISLGQDHAAWSSTAQNAFRRPDPAGAAGAVDGAGEAKRALLFGHHIQLGGGGSDPLPNPTTADSFTADVHLRSDRQANHRIGAAMKKSLSTSSVKFGSGTGEPWRRSLMLNPGAGVGRGRPVNPELQRTHWAVGLGPAQYDTMNLGSSHFQGFQPTR